MPCLHDKVLAAAADAAFTFSSNQKTKQVLVSLICRILDRKQFNKSNYFSADNKTGDSRWYCQRIERWKNHSTSVA